MRRLSSSGECRLQARSGPDAPESSTVPGPVLRSGSAFLLSEKGVGDVVGAPVLAAGLRRHTADTIVAANRLRRALAAQLVRPGARDGGGDYGSAV